MLRQAGVGIGVRGGRDEINEIADFWIDPPEQGGWHKLVGIIESLRLGLPLTAHGGSL
jgi:hypothetical protein